MVSRRVFMGGALASLAASSVRGSSAMPAIFAPSFDIYPNVVGDAFSIMSARGIVGTIYANPFLVGQSGQLSVSDLSLLDQCGWEIGGYVQGTVGGADATMVDMWLNNRNDANMRLKAVDDAMAALGFEIETIAPTGRSWNGPLANLATPRFKGVRAPIQGGGWQQYPVPNPANVPLGGTASLSSSDTLASLKAQLDDLIANGGIWFPVSHKWGPVGDSLTLPTSVAEPWMDYVQSKMTAGDLINKTVVQALAA